MLIFLYLQVIILQLRLFSFWKEKSPGFWEVLKENPLAFFEDAREISLSHLFSLISSSSKQYDVSTTAKAFRFQKVGKLAGACNTAEEEEVWYLFDPQLPFRFFLTAFYLPLLKFNNS